jgi:3-phosphoshikimate 1-carboxyvinyltransferase
MNELTLTPCTGPLDAVVSLPGSKSLTNRALVAAVLAGGTSVLNHALLADDTHRMIDALKSLGFGVTVDPEAERIEVTGRGGQIPASEATIDCGNSGTTIRFCTALASLGFGAYAFDGSTRMRERPVGPLADGLRRMGVGFEWLGKEGFAPYTVRAKGIRGGTFSFGSMDSSQFLTALLLIAPVCAADVLIDVNCPMVSRPYVEMTLALMESFGVAVIADMGETRSRFIVPAPQPYCPTNFDIEPDASGASYFLAAPAIVGGSVSVIGLGTDSVQGDARFVDVLERLGCGIERSATRLAVCGPDDGRLRAIDIDLNDMPDMVLTVAVLALFADGITRIRNVANLRIKETDRIAALATELSKLGARVEERDDGLAIDPPKHVTPAAIDTYDDHRMAMAFSLVGLRVGGISIRNPECVQKTFPDFFDRRARLCRSQC